MIGRRRAAGLAAAGAALLAIAGVASWKLAGGGGEDGRRSGKRAGEAMGGGGRALAAGLAGWRRPARCGAGGGEGDEASIVVGAREYRLAGGVLRGGGDDRRVVIGVVADARGADAATLANARWAAGEFARAGVDVVIALGGMGGDVAELEAVLGALAAPAGKTWLVVAVPGDREPVEAARTAVAALRARGVTIADGSRLTLVAVDGVAIGLVPGLGLAADGHAPMLVAGADGCGHDQADLDVVGEALAAEPGPRLVASYAPPRQPGPGGTDLALGGVHVGEPALASLAEKTGALALLHGWVDENAGRVARRGASVVAATGALSATPATLSDGALATGAALIVDVDGAKVRVRAVFPPRARLE